MQQEKKKSPVWNLWKWSLITQLPSITRQKHFSWKTTANAHIGNRKRNTNIWEVLLKKKTTRGELFKSDFNIKKFLKVKVRIRNISPGTATYNSMAIYFQHLLQDISSGLWQELFLSFLATLGLRKYRRMKKKDRKLGYHRKKGSQATLAPALSTACFSSIYRANHAKQIVFCFRIPKVLKEQRNGSCWP